MGICESIIETHILGRQASSLLCSTNSSCLSRALDPGGVFGSRFVPHPFVLESYKFFPIHSICFRSPEHTEGIQTFPLPLALSSALSHIHLYICVILCVFMYMFKYLINVCSAPIYGPKFPGYKSKFATDPTLAASCINNRGAE